MVGFSALRAIAADNRCRRSDHRGTLRPAGLRDHSNRRPIRLFSIRSFFEFPIFSVINSYLDIQEKCVQVESRRALMSMSIPINGVSRDDVRVKVDGIAPQQQEIEGGKNRLAGKKRKNVSRSSHVSHLGGDRVDCCGKEQKWNEGRLDEAGWTSCQGMFKIAGGTCSAARRRREGDVGGA